MAKKANGFIVVWTTMKPKDNIKNGSKDTYHDHWQAFIEGDDLQTAKQQAKAFYQGLVDERPGCIPRGHELYSASLCEVKESTEAHYTNI